MVKQEARAQALLRDRDAAKRRLQVWVALTVIWGVVLGWVVWGLVGRLVDSSAVVWGVYLAPLAVLLVGTLLAWLRLRRVDADLVALGP